jgi:hypothetical protein
MLFQQDRYYYAETSRPLTIPHLKSYDYNSRDWRTKVIVDELNAINIATSNNLVYKKNIEKYQNANYSKWYLEKCISILSKYIHINDKPSIIKADPYLEYFNNNNWMAMSIDNYDSQRLSIPSGIYFREEANLHVYIEFMIGHELTHWLISKLSDNHKSYRNAPFEFVPLIEEGICDYVSLFLCGEILQLSPNQLSNILTAHRFHPKHLKLWNNYGTSMNILKPLIEQNGESWLFHIMEEGRHNLKNIYNLPIKGKYNSSSKPIVIQALEKCQSLIYLSIEDWAVIKHVNEYSLTQFNFNDLKFIEMPEDFKQEALNSLIDQGLLLKENDTIFNFNENLLKNMRFYI